MATLKEAGDSFMKFGEMLFHKTEELAKIAKLNIDIKRAQYEMGVTEKNLGRSILGKIESGAASIDLTGPGIAEFVDKVNSLKTQIQARKDDIEKIKSQAQARRSGSDTQ